MSRAPKAQRTSSRPLTATIAILGLLLVGTACQPVRQGLLPVPAEATTQAAGDIGWEGASFSGSTGSPSGSKPESKLWWNDGSWWADMWDDATSDFYVHKLDLATHTWVRTATRLDERSTSRSDALWDGTHLYVASHSFAEGSSTTASAPAYLRRFSYQASNDSYTLDPGFPVQINNARSETLVIDRDSLGRLWATWTQNRQVMVAVSNAGGSVWGAPFALPVSGTRVSSDDIASVTAFGGNRIGIMWSNEDVDTMYFSAHDDNAPNGTWGPAEAAYRGNSAADDHINLKNIADQNGRILAAVKTSTTGSTPLVHLLDRAANGTWSSHVYGYGTDGHTRPIVVVDQQQGQVHMFATAGQSGGSIYEKTAPLSNISFAPGRGTAVLTDASSDDINNPTSTKQSVNGTTGLVVLATNDTTRRYWTHYDPLGGTPAPTAPVASFTASPTNGDAPLDVTFTDTSTQSPTSWAWEFGDGGTSTERNPVHQYTQPGLYTVTLTATNAIGPGTIVRTDLVTVTEPPLVTDPVTFSATADAMIKSTSPTRNYGLDAVLRTRSDSPAYRSLIRFDVTGLTGAPDRAILRLWVTDKSRAAGTVSAVGTSWAENAVTWATAPANGSQVASIGAVTAGTWIEIDVTAAVSQDGPIAFALTGTSTDSAIFASRETSTAPQLVITQLVAP